MSIPDVLLKQLEERCEALGKTPVEAVRDWLDNNPAPTPAAERPAYFCFACSDTGRTHKDNEYCTCLAGEEARRHERGE